MFANSFVPTINRPTRVTETSGTVIDNIFTNCYDINSKTVQGILTTDISDHYAVFHVNNRIKSSVDKDQSMIIRIMNEKNYDKYKLAIQNFDWSKVTNLNSCQYAFSAFIKKYESNI